MFTGIIQAVGSIQALQQTRGDARITIRTGALPLADVNLGDSIAVNGVCLTAVALPGDGFVADVSSETLLCSTLGALTVGDAVNLEKALTLSTPLGGHLVSGHVDGVGVIAARTDDARSVRFEIEAPAGIAHYIAEKGSVCVDGVSLTVNEIRDCVFALNIVPHTLAQTTMGDFQTSQRVNLEVDLIARYLERLMLGGQTTERKSMTLDFLSKHGFTG